MSIELRHLGIGYGRRTLLDDVSTTFAQGSLTALLGRNGSGKSTLLRALAGLGPVASGEVLLCGRPLVQLSPLERASTVSFVTTDKVRIANLACEDVVALGRAPYTNWDGCIHGSDLIVSWCYGHLVELAVPAAYDEKLARWRREDLPIVPETWKTGVLRDKYKQFETLRGRMQRGDRETVARALELVGMSSFARKTMDAMSDGECQRILIARALAQDTPVILLDEPTAFLDLPNRYELCTLLQRLAREEGKCVLFSTHDLDIALSLCDSVALIDTPHLHHLPTPEMVRSGHIERLFSGGGITFDPVSQTVRPAEKG